MEALQRKKIECNVENKPLNLKWSLYGRQDATKIWFDTVIKHFKQHNLFGITSAPFVFHKNVMIVIRFVDDLFSLAIETKDFEKTKPALFALFVVRDLGKPTTFPGMEIDRYI